MSVEVGGSAEREWSALVATAVLGTDRRRAPAAEPGWESLSRGRGADADPAIELLDRVLAVSSARRAGIIPAPAPASIPTAPDDERPECSTEAAELLARLLRGEHQIVLPEWFERCAAGGWRPPRHLTPALLLRGRRNPAFDAVVRPLIGPFASWLAEAMPELGVPAWPKPVVIAEADRFRAPATVADSAAVTAAVVETFLDRSATWAAAGQLRLAIAALDVGWMPALELELSRVPFHAITERSRVDLLGLAQMRRRVAASLTR